MQAAPQRTLPARIVLYDGVCALCNRATTWILDHDVNRAFHFAPLQGETAAHLRQLHPEIPDGLETIVLVEDGRVHRRSKAIIHIARHLGRPWRWGYGARWVPAPILDLVYRLVAAVRYRIWGTYEVCRALASEDRSRLLP